MGADGSVEGATISEGVREERKRANANYVLLQERRMHPHKPVRGKGAHFLHYCHHQQSWVPLPTWPVKSSLFLH